MIAHTYTHKDTTHIYKYTRTRTHTHKHYTYTHSGMPISRLEAFASMIVFTRA